VDTIICGGQPGLWAEHSMSHTVSGAFSQASEDHCHHGDVQTPSKIEPVVAEDLRLEKLSKRPINAGTDRSRSLR